MWGFMRVMLHGLLPLAVESWWCETSALTGCRGHPRHFAKEEAKGVADKFKALERLPIAFTQQHVFIDWDGDGNLDVIMVNNQGLDLLEQGDSGLFVKKEPSPFKDAYRSSSTYYCLPEVFDINGDGKLDMLLAAEQGGVKYFENNNGLQEKTGKENPFVNIGDSHVCGHLSVADWDQDGRLDLLITDLANPMRHFRQDSEGQFQLVDDSPLLRVTANRTLFRRPLMVDWNMDGRTDLILVEQPFRRGLLADLFASLIPLPPDESTCEPLIFLQDEAGSLYESTAPKGVLQNRGCKYGPISLVDVDGDMDLDVILLAASVMEERTLELYEHLENHSLAIPGSQQATSFPLSQIKFRSKSVFARNNGIAYRPFLADWDLDGDLDLALIPDFIARKGAGEPTRFFRHEADDHVSEVSAPNSSCRLNFSFPFSATDFDGDGRLDLMGGGIDRDEHDNPLTMVCLQTADGYVLLEKEKNPFYGGGCTFGDKFSFLDWDSDGDVDQICMDSWKRLQFVEHLSNGSLATHLLPVPDTRDYVAADFDGDGDVDLLLVVGGIQGWKYYERREDGSLDELLEHDNPFPDSLWKLISPSASTASGKNEIFAALGDWNGDGSLDLVAVTLHMASLFLNKPVQNFVEYDGSGSPFSGIHMANPAFAEWNIVDVDGDGDLDFVFMPEGKTSMSTFNDSFLGGPAAHQYFERLENGELVKREGAANPLRLAPRGGQMYETKEPYVPKSQQTVPGSSHVVADVDGDGDLDIVHSFKKGFAYAEQRNGSFVILRSYDNPFYQGFLAQLFENSQWDCWTLVDFDRDGDLDLVKIKPVDPTNLLSVHRILYYEQASPRWSFDGSNSSFHRSAGKFRQRQGKDNPFWSVDLAALPDKKGWGSWCPAVADLDQDGDLDLILEDHPHFLYFQQQNGSFKFVEDNPFAEVSLIDKDVQGSLLKFQFVDWDSDGMMDLVASKSTKMHYFKRGQCFANSACHSSASCNKKTGRCECLTGSNSSECRICNDYHTRQDSTCRSCPGFGSLSGTCTHRGICDDDVDARQRQAAKNISGFGRAGATGSGQCTCNAPFSGVACEEGECPPGQRLHRNAEVSNATEKYSHWQACAPCQLGRYKKTSGNQECENCPEGLVPNANRSSCVQCPLGRIPTNSSSCGKCPAGSVAALGASDCTHCGAGSAPNADLSECVRCADGQVAHPRSAQCTPCELGWVPDASRIDCVKCTGQDYALDGYEECRRCTFPAMILGVENWCTSLYFFLFLLAFLLLALLVAAIFGRCRLECFKGRLRKLVKQQDWCELYATKTSAWEYGIWHLAAQGALETKKTEVKTRSFQLGISLHYVFEELQAIYREKALQAEWRLDTFGPATRSGFFVRLRNSGGDVSDREAAWNALPPCAAPDNPNFHQVAGLMAYGPLALGKGQYCPRDGRLDCSIVDALEASKRSGRATWFLSWVWGYKFSTVFGALSRWWRRHQIVSGDVCGDVYIWWCVMVNNQFRMLEEGQTAEATNLFDVFGRQLAGIGKMLMCLDKMKEGIYTTRIWCIFEVFVACKGGIPTTVILPQLELDGDGINTLQELTEQCRVDAQSAQASVPEDAVAIKQKIMEDHGSFDFVNQTVEKELWCEVIKFLEGDSNPSTSSGPSAGAASSSPTEDAPPCGSGSEDATSAEVRKAKPGCQLQ